MITPARIFQSEPSWFDMFASPRVAEWDPYVVLSFTLLAIVAGVVTARRRRAKFEPIAG